jgi:hypothetical protein
MKRRLLAPLVLAPVLASALAVPVRAAPAALATIGPTKTAWYDATYPTPSVPPPPPPPGVGAGDLVVGGATLPLPVGTMTTPTALSALSFTVPEGATAASLTLVLTSAPSTAGPGAKAPAGVTPEACPATTEFRAGGRQPFDQVPAYDCSGQTSFGHLSSDGKSVIFSDIARVARGKLVSFVIRPGTPGADRLVFAPPPPTALTLLPFDAAPSFDAGGSSQPPPTATAATPAPVTPAPAAQGPALPQPDPVSTIPTPSPPVVAPVVPGTGPAAAAMSAVTASPSSDNARVRAAALAGLALLVSMVSLVAYTDGRTSRRVVQQEWGFGRYRRPRQGQAPSL